MANTVKHQHGTAVVVDGIGILIIGPAGSGKSELALGLLDKGHRFLADDHVLIYPNGTMSCPPHQSGLLYVRDLGLLDLRLLYPTQIQLRPHRLDFVIQLQDHAQAVLDNLELTRETFTFTNGSVPQYALCRYSLIDLCIKVETLLKQVTLLKHGHRIGPSFINHSDQQG